VPGSPDLQRFGAIPIRRMPFGPSWPCAEPRREPERRRIGLGIVLEKVDDIVTPGTITDDLYTYRQRKRDTRRPHDCQDNIRKLLRIGNKDLSLPKVLALRPSGLRPNASKSNG
jgi:hypothetical protein